MVLPLHRGPWTLDDVLAPPEDRETGPDFTVIRRRDFDGVSFPVGDVLLVGEVGHDGVLTVTEPFPVRLHLLTWVTHEPVTVAP